MLIVFSSFRGFARQRRLVGAARILLVLMAGVWLCGSPGDKGIRAEQASTPVYKHPKLNTILATLSAAVPQEHALWQSARRARIPAGFTMESMPKAVRDASQRSEEHTSELQSH